MLPLLNSEFVSYEIPYPIRLAYSLFSSFDLNCYSGIAHNHSVSVESFQFALNRSELCISGKAQKQQRYQFMASLKLDLMFLFGTELITLDRLPKVVSVHAP
jgi:hypothetical protein